MSESAKPVIVYGAGGHGKVVLDALEVSGRRVLGFVDDQPQSSDYCGYLVHTGLDAKEIGEEFEVIVAIGDVAARERVTDLVLDAGHDLTAAVHSSAVIARDVAVEPGVMVLAQAAVNPGCRLGRCAIINTGATIDHDCSIGEFSHIGPGARLAGGVVVGERVMVGMGACVIPGVRIGADAIVGAGAAVIRDVQPGDTVAGNPARKLPVRGNGGMT